MVDTAVRRKAYHLFYSKGILSLKTWRPARGEQHTGGGSCPRVPRLRVPLTMTPFKCRSPCKRVSSSLLQATFLLPKSPPTTSSLLPHRQGGPLDEEDLATSEPLTVPLFDGLGYHCVPHCGVYAKDDYEPALPFAFVSLPYELLQRTLHLAGQSLLPHRLREELTGPASPWFATESSSFYLMVHPIPSMKECQHFMCDSRREINVITHTWTLPDVQFTPELEVWLPPSSSLPPLACSAP